MGLEIRSGGAIAVDPESLRELAARLDQAGRWVDSAATGARAAIDVLWCAPQLGHACSWQVDQLQHRMAMFARDLADFATRVRTTADAYELADLMFQLELSWAWDDPYDTEGFEEHGPRCTHHRAPPRQRGGIRRGAGAAEDLARGLGLR